MKTGDLLAGTYRILRKLGQGGGGSVFLSVHERTCQLWAVKEAVKSACQISDGEIRYWKHFTYPGVPRMVDIVEEHEMIYFIMEYIPGKTLQEILEREEKLPVRQILDIALQLCEILEYLHNRVPAIIHGDVKPANILCKGDNKLVLVDFGASRTTDWTGVSIGTRSYAAPELMTPGVIPDGRADIYSLGVLIYRMRKGCLPPDARKKPVVRKELDMIAERCLRPEKEARYSSCKDLGKDLKKLKTRNTFLSGSLAILSIILLCAGGVWTEIKQSAKEQKTYETYLKSSNILDYKSAIFLAPNREEAYLKLLQTILLNDRLEPEEDIQIRSILNETESEFQNNEQGYLAFAWELGMAYWYYYEESGNKKYAVPWFQKIVDASEVEESKKLRAAAFTKIGMFYEELGRKERTGDFVVSFKQCWEDLVYLSSLNAAEEDNEITALHIWNEVITLQYTYMWEFQRAGVTAGEMDQVMDRIRKKMSTISDEKREAARHKLKSDIEKKLQQTEESKERLYGKEN